jgi:hypothetical protein
VANKACSDERFTKDKVWSSRELLLGIEAQATVSNAISMMIDTSKRNAKHATISLELCNTSFLLLFQNKYPYHDSGTSQGQEPCQLA